ncbi:rCG28823 [Rattus norvegicus]|uniref:RCG28823 n=1 Tax=Rattus norvegicus TaxID=10116 RepID=A6HV53_RAT|nr:rCG28823 [Rattus norvegicus]
MYSKRVQGVHAERLKVLMRLSEMKTMSVGPVVFPQAPNVSMTGSNVSLLLKSRKSL